MINAILGSLIGIVMALVVLIVFRSPLWAQRERRRDALDPVHLARRTLGHTCGRPYVQDGTLHRSGSATCPLCTTQHEQGSGVSGVGVVITSAVSEPVRLKTEDVICTHPVLSDGHCTEAACWNFPIPPEREAQLPRWKLTIRGARLER